MAAVTFLEGSTLKVSKGLSGFNVVAEPRAPEACAMSGRRERSPRGRSRSNGSGLSSISSARMNQRPLTAAEAAAEVVAEAQRARSQSRARQRARSVPADTSPTYHRPAGVDRRPLPSEGRTNGQLPQLPGMSNAPGQASTQNPVVAQGNGAGGLSESLVRQMLQAQDDQLRAQSGSTPANGCDVARRHQVGNHNCTASPAKRCI